MKRTAIVLAAAAILLVAAPAQAQTTLAAGDVAFTFYQADTPDTFTFLLMVDVQNTTTLRFTDNGWLSGGGFRANEGIIEWAATSDLTAYTQITITTPDSGVTFTATSGTVTVPDTGFALATAGDQILAYQGTEASPSFVTAINDHNWDATAADSNTSALPPGLTDGTNAIHFPIALPGTDNGQYNCATTVGVPAVLNAAINNGANWTTSDTILTPAPCSFTVPVELMGFTAD
ncbi:hypothetical protein FBQ97_13865 [Acidobacteria bacterium ACD]|nr:hypothetical protein [Acidobacteria bacterium ACD]